MSGHADDRAEHSPDRLDHVKAMMTTLRQLREINDRGYRAHRDARHLNDKDMAVLGYLSQEWTDQRAVSPKDIAGHLGLTSATTTGIIDRLEAEGYLYRHRTTDDRRAVYLRPAPAVKDWVEQHPVESLRSGLIDAAVDLTCDEVRIVQSYLSAVLDNVRQRLT